jgi:hypothetical protein
MKNGKILGNLLFATVNIISTPDDQPIISRLHHLLLLSPGTRFANLLVPRADLYVILIQTRAPY